MPADPMLTEREHDLIMAIKWLVKDVEAALPLRKSESIKANALWQRVKWSLSKAREAVYRIEPKEPADARP